MSSDDLHLLRVYVDVSAVRDGAPYWEVLMARAKSMGLSNAAVLQILDGYGRAAMVHRGKALTSRPGGM